MIRWALLLLLAGCASIPTPEQLRATALALRFEKGACSGNAVGPNLVQTAKHCEAGGKLIAVNGVPVNVRVTIEKDGDRMILSLDQPYFSTWATFGPMPKQGDRVRWWGNPLGEADVYREGYVAKVSPDGVLIVATVCPGDSGSGAFNDAGQIVAIVVSKSTKLPCTFAWAIPPT